MDVNDDMGCLDARVVRAFFASKLAPTGELDAEVYLSHCIIVLRL